jgi:hypothetical protein
MFSLTVLLLPVSAGAAGVVEAAGVSRAGVSAGASCAGVSAAAGVCSELVSLLSFAAGVCSTVSEPLSSSLDCELVSEEYELLLLSLLLLSLLSELLDEPPPLQYLVG